jgi:hypothetical protein
MNIYYSNFSKVDLKHETTEGVNLESCPTPLFDPYAFPPVVGYTANPMEVYPFNPYGT